MRGGLFRLGGASRLHKCSAIEQAVQPRVGVTYEVLIGILTQGGVLPTPVANRRKQSHFVEALIQQLQALTRSRRCAAQASEERCSQPWIAPLSRAKLTQLPRRCVAVANVWGQALWHVSP